MAGNANTEDVIQAWLLAKLAERLGIEPHDIDTREPLASYGLGSTEAVSLAGELADWLGRDLSAALVYEHPTIEALARHLAGSPDVSAAASRGRQDAGANGEPVAIIGVGCRFPGANGPGAFWRLLCIRSRHWGCRRCARGYVQFQWSWRPCLHCLGLGLGIGRPGEKSW